MIDTQIIQQSKQLIEDADVVLIGAGAGLSTAAGLHYSGKRFSDNFSDYIDEYQLTDMYSSVFYPFKSKEEKWAYLSRHIKLNGYDAEPGQVYNDLLNLVKGKSYFVITTNGDGLFKKAGFNTDQIFATQGDYQQFQCAKGCHNTLYHNEKMVMQMVKQFNNFRIPTELLPICPVCGEDLVPHLRIDQFFVENEDWHLANDRYTQFVRNAKDKKMVLLELGIGFNTPSIIRWPFEQMAHQFTNTELIRVNMDSVEPNYKIPATSILLKSGIAEYLAQMQ
ncbi:SIR2 family NAD-dependent protein deacylase [Labilibacter marinus]|uniref:SIR2 family NAD-dependent protein deacylase n=1 Tax=Labilibacter marinus TaxID=1477105 RepID=UPI0018E96F6F|nr:Sir2 family NAD-dependent protein deacetylase [Labilibacter marinus]